MPAPAIDRDDPARPMLFQPFKIRGLTLRNRLVVPPMVHYRGSPGSTCGTFHTVHLGRYALGGFGLVFVEATGVEQVGLINEFDLGIWNDAQVESFKPLIAFMKGENTATISAVRVKAVEMAVRFQPNCSLSGLTNTPNAKITSEPKLTAIPITAVITMTHPRVTRSANIHSFSLTGRKPAIVFSHYPDKGPATNGFALLSQTTPIFNIDKSTRSRCSQNRSTLSHA